MARLRAWGFNTIGNWSDPWLYEDRRMPYTATLHVEGVIATLPSGSDFWSWMVDPFDASFAEAADRARKVLPSVETTRGASDILWTTSSLGETWRMSEVAMA